MKHIFARKNLFLAGLFLLALPLFCWMQWQPKPWLDHLLSAGPLAGRISYSDVAKSFPGVKLKNVDIILTQNGRLVLDNILLRPALLPLLAGSPAVSTRIQTDGMHAKLVASLHHVQVKLTDIDLGLDAAKLARFDPQLLLFALKGSLALRGHVLLQSATALPENGDLTMVWRKPASNLLPTGLDEIRLRIVATRVQGATTWNWTLSSRPQQIGGEGKIISDGSDIRQWRLQGKLQIAKDMPERMLSGSLGAPHWQ